MKHSKGATNRKVGGKATGGRRTGAMISMTLAVALLGVLPVLGGTNPALAAADSVSYNNLKVLVHTTDNFPATYVFSAYNSSGWLIAWSQSNYPTSSFELPSATYLITVNAFQQDYYGCYAYAVQATASSSVTAAEVEGGTPAVMPPCQSYAPRSEYGYFLQAVSDSTTLSINTQPLSQTSSQLSIRVEYPNGTAASDVSVSAYIVGASYWWGGYENNFIMYSQTGPDGLANLVVPSVPVQLTAWKSIPVELPKNETTVQTIVAGEKVNVTVYWQPMYVSFGSSALIVPPQSSATMTLHYQQPNYWPMPYEVQGKGAPVRDAGALPGTDMGGLPPYPQAQDGLGYGGALPGIVPTLPSVQISPLTQSGTTSADSPFGSVPMLAVAIAALAAIALASVSLAITIRRKN
ncbi:MAG: hypothetical protein HYW93_06435 [Thaumarchaeota archaeon]|nr:hypothetical protein [Nitrososphaerota archaeon]